MRITLDIDGPVADTLRAIGLALENPERIAALGAEVEAQEAEIIRLYAQHETDTRLIEGLREQLSRKDSPAPALTPALPPVSGEGLVPENVVPDIGMGSSTGRTPGRNPGDAGSIPAPSTSSPCMLFSCVSAALKDPESGGWFCGLHIAVPLSIRLEAKRAFRKKAASG